MKKLLTIAGMALAVTACGGGGGGGSSSTTSNTSSNPQITQAQDIVSNENFEFSTSRKIAINIDLEQARTVEGFLSLCTDYSGTEGNYQVNYDSCTVRAVLNAGVYTGEMEVTNDIESIIGVVWLNDPNAQPIYQIFNQTVSGQRQRRGGNQYEIVWR